MSPVKEQTLAQQFSLEGIGIHSGSRSRVTVRPVDSGGIRFRRVDISGAPEIPADLDFVKETDRGTNLGIGEVRIMTIEHIMGSLMVSEVDHALVEVSGDEIPILDGSFQPFLEAINEAGLKELSSNAQVVSVREIVDVVCSCDTSYTIIPDQRLKISATINFEHRAIGRQVGDFEINPTHFAKEIAPARTFGFESEVQYLNEKGLARGASFANTIVLNDAEVISGELRFEDEFLRHKVGDLLGDMALIGKRIRASIICEKPGHGCNIKMARILRDKGELHV